MSKKEEFKEFISNKPELIEYMKDNDVTIQKLYEIYDIYGEDAKAWDTYTRDKKVNFSKLSDVMKNLNLDEIQKHINTAQKALGMVEDLTTKSEDAIKKAVKGPLTSRPLNKFFED